MGLLDDLNDAERTLIKNLPNLDDVLPRIREGQSSWRNSCIKIYKQAYDSGSVRILENPYLGYYRMDAAYATQYQDRSKNGVIVFLKPKINSEVDFVYYYGMGVDNFLDQVKDGYILPTLSNVELYSSDFWHLFFERWKQKVDVVPLYANPLELIYAKSRGYKSEKEIWQSSYNEIISQFPEINKISLIQNISFDDYGSRLPQQNTLEYFGERTERLKMLQLDGLSNAIFYSLKQARYNLNNVMEFDRNFRLARNLAFSLFHLYGSSIYYAKGGPVNASPSDITIWNDTFNGLRNISKSIKLNYIEETLNDLTSHTLVNLKSDIPFACRQAKTREEFESDYYKMNKSDDVNTVREELTKHENYAKDLLDKVSTNADITKFEKTIDRAHQAGNQYFETLKGILKKPIIKKTFKIGSTLASSIPLLQPLKIIFDVGKEVIESLEEKPKEQKPTTFINYNPQFIFFELDRPLFIKK